jgi:hypothetical protein
MVVAVARRIDREFASGPVKAKFRPPTLLLVPTRRPLGPRAFRLRVQTVSLRLWRRFRIVPGSG